MAAKRPRGERPGGEMSHPRRLSRASATMRPLTTDSSVTDSSDRAARGTNLNIINPSFFIISNKYHSTY
jgi:hypothetical protein